MTTSSTRLLARITSKFASVSIRPSQQAGRPFSQTCLRRQDERAPSESLLGILSAAQGRPAQSGTASRPASASRETAEDLTSVKRALATDTLSRAMNISPSDSAHQNDEYDDSWGPQHEPFHFHVYAHKHNTHVTVTLPNRNPIISMSTGNIGFKKTKRSSYDAAYQLTAFVLDKLNQAGWHRKITSLEVVLRGFGAGREAATKVLLGNEGRLLRPTIKKVSDATKLKFGGTRSPRPKRLG